jgi:methionine sulfoxide reductase heme-binding subunit
MGEGLGSVRALSFKRAALWLALASPAALMLWAFSTHETPAMDLLHPTGELSLRLMILSLLPGPLAEFFRLNRFLRGWLSIRRNLGVAAFAYAALHLLFYCVDMNSVAAVLEEVALPAIWTGWISFAAMMAAASISTDAAMRRLGRKWKQIQRGIYAAFVLALAHWVLLDRVWGPAIVHCIPLIIAWLLRACSHTGNWKWRRI